MKPFLSSQHSEDNTFGKRLGMTSGPSLSLAVVLVVPVRTLGSKYHFTLLHRQTISSSTALIFSNTWRRPPSLSSARRQALGNPCFRWMWEFSRACSLPLSLLSIPMNLHVKLFLPVLSSHSFLLCLSLSLPHPLSFPPLPLFSVQHAYEFAVETVSARPHHLFGNKVNM